MKKVTAVLVAYNSAHIIGETLSSLLCEPNIHNVIVVDNASIDDTCSRITATFPEVILIQNEKNLGFGAGNNVALAQVQTEYALLVNPDAILKPGALVQLLDAAARYPDVALYAPRLFYEDGRIQPSHKVNLFRRKETRGEYICPEGDICAEFFSGAIWMLRMEPLRKVGFFDPELFFYFEDDDLCLRLRAAGYGLMMVANAHAVHGMGKSSIPSTQSRAFRLYHNTWSRLYIEYKYQGRERAQRMTRRKYWRYQLLWLSGIPALVNRYGPRLRAAKDFSAYLAIKPINQPLKPAAIAQPSNSFNAIKPLQSPLHVSQKTIDYV